LGGDYEAGNSTGTLTQPVFNELARLIRDRLSDTNYTHSQSPLLFFFLETTRMSIRRCT
jgi:hypothetical protein